MVVAQLIDYRGGHEDYLRWRGCGVGGRVVPWALLSDAS